MPTVCPVGVTPFKDLQVSEVSDISMNIYTSGNFQTMPTMWKTGATPFEDVQVADVGDVSMNIYNLPEAITQIKAAYDRLVANGCTPLTMGGDHTITYPILQAIKVSWLLVVVAVMMM